MFRDYGKDTLPVLVTKQLTITGGTVGRVSGRKDTNYI